MKCDVVQTRLLALPDVRRLPTDLREHVTGCRACVGFARGLSKLDALIPKIPVPASSPEVQVTFFEHIAASTPIITRFPTAPRRDSSGTLSAIWAKREQWQIAAGVAASLMVGVVVWWFATTTQTQPRPEVVKLRHELLNREVKHLAALTKANTAQDRIAVWANFAQELQTEVKNVHLMAQGNEMVTLERMFDKTVNEGLIKQAATLENLTVADRQKSLTDAVSKLKAAEADAMTLANNATPTSKPVLNRMAKTAKDGRTQLETIIKSGKVAS